MSTRPSAAGPAEGRRALAICSPSAPSLFVLCFAALLCWPSLCRSLVCVLARPLLLLALSWQAPTALHFAPLATTVPAARRSSPRLAPSVRASPRGTACTGTLSCFAQALNVVPVKGGFYGAPVLPGSIGPAACSADTRYSASGALLPPPVATYTCGKTPAPLRSPAAPALSAFWCLPRRSLLMPLFCRA